MKFLNCIKLLKCLCSAGAFIGYNKVDVLIDVRRAQLIDGTTLTRHVFASCVHANGFQVVDRPRPRFFTDLGFYVQTSNCYVFALFPVLSFLAAKIRRRGSAAISVMFSIELSDAIDRLATFI